MEDLLRRLEANQTRLSALRPLQPPLLAQLRAYFRVGLTWTSNALEGSSLTESETKVLLEDGLTVGGKPIREYYEATGHARAFDAMMNRLSDPAALSEATLRELHRLFYAQIDESQAGRYRTQPVLITGSKHATPAPSKVPAQMTALAAWLQAGESTARPVRFAAQAHKRFVFIHPFIDGNGRVARLLMNLCLLRAGYPPAVIPPILRGEYIDLLEKAHTDDAPFERFIAERVLETQKDLLRLLPLPQ
jgi:Fic family protein